MAESVITKRAISKSLKALTKEKPFDKITVKDISDKCGINRQTFYYHYSDKFALLKDIYFEELFLPNMTGITFENWDGKVCNMLAQMKEELYFYSNTIRYANTFISSFMVDNACEIFSMAISYLEESGNMSETTLEEHSFISKFFAYGITGIIGEWVKNGAESSPKLVARRMKEMLDYCKEAAAKNA